MTARIALVGAGLMGTGLARLFTAIGWPVAVWDRDDAALDRLVRAVPATRRASSLADAVVGADLVIEAVAERIEIKQDLFEILARITETSTILATNSSVIPVAAVAHLVSDSDAGRVVGMHFWNPPDLVPLVEVIQGPRTADSTVSDCVALLTAAGREPVPVRADTVPGNRLQHALWREAMALVDEGVCSPADVDRIVKRSFGARLAVLGPLENADLVGLELTRQIHDVVLPTLSTATTPAQGLIDRYEGGGRYYRDDAALAQVRARLAHYLQTAFVAGESE